MKIKLESNRGPKPNPKITSRILEVIQNDEDMYLEEIARETEIYRETILNHLEKLKDRGLVEEERKGQLRIFRCVGDEDNDDGE